jgi:hypothetical protein
VVLLGVAARALRGCARRDVIGRGGGLRGDEQFERKPSCRWTAAGLGRGAADQEREGSGSAGMGACRMLRRSHGQLQVSWLWSAGRMGSSPCGPRFFRGCPG